MTSTREVIILCAICVTLLLLLHRRRRALQNISEKRLWVHPLNRDRDDSGLWVVKLKKMMLYPDRFFQYFRMTPESFTYILNKIRPIIQKQDTVMRKSIEPELRLAITIHHLAEGASYGSIAVHYSLGKSTISGIITEVCKAIWDVLQPIYMPVPRTHDSWRVISDGFMEKWNFPNCCGAVDGKHIIVMSPPGSNSEYFNYKKFFSLNLMAITDSQYRFLFIDVGQKGSISDGGVFEHSVFGQAFLDGSVNLPPPTRLLGTDVDIPMVLVADDAFPLKTNIMKPYSGRDSRNDVVKRRFNYRLSRARRVVENSFGILCQRWRLFYKPIQGQPESVTTLVKAACVLHNFLCWKNDQSYVPRGFGDCVLNNGDLVEGDWRVGGLGTGLVDIAAVGRNHTNHAAAIRETFAEYFSGAGAVAWQDGYIERR